MSKKDTYSYICSSCLIILVLVLMWGPVIYIKTNEHISKETRIALKTEKNLKKELEKMSLDVLSNLNNNLKIDLLSKKFERTSTEDISGDISYISDTGVVIYGEGNGESISQDIYIYNLNIKNNSKYNIYIKPHYFDSQVSPVLAEDINTDIASLDKNIYIDKNTSANVKVEHSGKDSKNIFYKMNVSDEVKVKVKGKVLILPVTIYLSIDLCDNIAKITSLDFSVEGNDIENALSKSFNLNFERKCTNATYSYNLDSDEK